MIGVHFQDGSHVSSLSAIFSTKRKEVLRKGVLLL
jgi:hypothetical protein